MSRTVRTVEPQDSLEHAHAVMLLARIHHLVVMSRGEIIGVLTAHDITRATGRASPWLVEDAMRPQLITGTPDLAVGAAAALLRGHSIGCLPVVDRGRLVGIVTTSDLLALLVRDGDPRAQAPRERHAQGTAR